MLRSLLAAAVLTCGASIVQAQAVPGQPAPGFTLNDLFGERVNLGDFRGRWVVLEWNNPNCPFVMKHYTSGNMQSLQKRYTGEDVAWFTINSTAPGHSDHMTNDVKAGWIREQRAVPTAVLVDASGQVGRAYNARTTPQMYVIDPQGKLVYAGAIDDKRSANPADIKTATNYVVQALAEARGGKSVSVASTQPYGCSVKYAD